MSLPLFVMAVESDHDECCMKNVSCADTHAVHLFPTNVQRCHLSLNLSLGPKLTTVAINSGNMDSTGVMCSPFGNTGLVPTKNDTFYL